MNKLAAWAFVGGIALTSAAYTAEGATPAPSAEEQMMAAYEAAAKVGPQHEGLQYFVGKWQEEISVSMDPKAPPSKSKGAAVIQSIMGGRFVQMFHAGSFMGMPHIGQGLTGYDNVTGKYLSQWIDNSSGAIFLATGSYDEAGKTYTFNGEMTDPMNPTKRTPVREVVRIESPDRYVFEWHETHEGKERKAMSIAYTRMK